MLYSAFQDIINAIDGGDDNDKSNDTIFKPENTLELDSLSLEQLLLQREIFERHLIVTSNLNMDITRALIRKLFVKIVDRSQRRKFLDNEIEYFKRNFTSNSESFQSTGIDVEKEDLKLLW